jgi:small-conductance mechanosensitive channel
MSELIAGLSLPDFLTADRLLALLGALLTLVVGIILARILSAGFARAVRARLSAQESMLVRRLAFYILLALVLATTLHQLGFQLGVILGAAGILTVAIGFASQTSASNLISGLFLIAERPFVVGDIIRADGTTGEVLSIDLLSVKLRTFDNLFVRIPNETIIKTQVTTLTKFPIRRVDVQVGVAYKEDVTRVTDVLMDIADKNPLCLNEPKPIIIFKGFGDSALEFQFSVWAVRTNYLDLLNSIKRDIKAAFDEQGIEIPFPHRTLYTGTVTDPFPVRVVEDSPASRS